MKSDAERALKNDKKQYRSMPSVKELIILFPNFGRNLQLAIIRCSRTYTFPFWFISFQISFLVHQTSRKTRECNPKQNLCTNDALLSCQGQFGPFPAMLNVNIKNTTMQYLKLFEYNNCFTLFHNSIRARKRNRIQIPSGRYSHCIQVHVLGL